jgi:hypothetical protein
MSAWVAAKKYCERSFDDIAAGTGRSLDCLIAAVAVDVSHASSCLSARSAQSVFAVAVLRILAAALEPVYLTNRPLAFP